MKLSTPVAVVIGAIFIAAAILYASRSGRYQLVGGGDGFIVRLDTRSGATAVCLPHKARVGDTIVVSAPCNGRRD